MQPTEAGEGEASERISVLIVDDHQMFAQAVASVLSGEDDITVAGLAGTLAEARDSLASMHVDVVLMDQRLPDGRGTDAVAEFRGLSRGVRVLMLSAGVDDSLLSEAIRAGCSGYVNKAESIEHLAAAVRATHSGATSISPEVLSRLVAGSGEVRAGSRLTRRELNILEMMAEGLSTADICDRAMISPNTLRNHTQKILTKLGAHTRVEAVTRAIRDGLVRIHER